MDIIDNWLPGKATGKDTAVLDNIMDGFKSVIAKTFDSLVPGAMALSQISAGRIISNKMELSFEGVNRREFNYTFVFIPKSEKEAQLIEKIIWMSVKEYSGYIPAEMAKNVLYENNISAFI